MTGFLCMLQVGWGQDGHYYYIVNNNRGSILT